jgi:sterol desaturase/sphingolipid hydroxylase (fatty acid hydroxylase superfamily)
VVFLYSYTKYSFKKPSEPPTQAEFLALKDTDMQQYISAHLERKKELMKIWRDQHQRERRILIVLTSWIVGLFTLSALIELIHVGLDWAFLEGWAPILSCISVIGIFILTSLGFGYANSSSSYERYLITQFKFYKRLKKVADECATYTEFVQRYSHPSLMNWLFKGW